MIAQAVALTFIFVIVTMDLTTGRQLNDGIRSPCETLNCANNAVCMEVLSENRSESKASFSGIAEFCHHYNADDKMPVNCVFITTSGPTQDDGGTVYVAPLVLSILFVIGLCILLAVIVKRKYIECLYKYQPCFSSKRKSDTTSLYMGTGSRRKRDKSKQHLMPLPQRPPPDIVLHPPSSPGRPPHKLAQSTRGYTSTFSARNESAIPLTTVIEYGTSGDTPTAIEGGANDDVSFSADSSLIVHRVDVES